MLLQRAQETDLQAICALYQLVCASMEANGLRQWHWGDYPNQQMLARSITAHSMYCCKDEQGIYAAVSIDLHQAPEYHQLNWLFGVRPGVFHRLAVHPDRQHSGIGRAILGEAQHILRGMGCDSMRCHTYRDNACAVRCCITQDMRMSGKVYMNDRPRHFICFEKCLTDDCPLLPVRMHPAFRGGSLTPWGGDKLRRIYHKPVRDIPTGESLEVSCIPNFESNNDTAESLPSLIQKYGTAFAGDYAHKPFPLLLKLIDAKNVLSVQVHPDDAYAAAHESGKLGKAEAWLIIDAPEGSELIYGIHPGVTKEQLKAACEQGSAVEPLLRRVPVKSGDVCYIPAGCVHAIGAGIMLYEIQQSSDITYRFYDWDRVDAKGNRRELHLAKALDVTDLSIRLDPIPEPVPRPRDRLVRVIDADHFTLDLMHVTTQIPVPQINNFAIFTAFDGTITLSWPTSSITLSMGDTLYLPASSPTYTISGSGRAALAMPK